MSNSKTQNGLVDKIEKPVMNQPNPLKGDIGDISNHPNKRLIKGSNGSLETRYKPDKHDNQVSQQERGHKGTRGAIRFEGGTSHYKWDIYETY